ncbi:MAG: universal stress protein [Bacteroidota bacterium]|nr:universal stress protein [Bacteroidota bacterium]
MNKKIIIPIDFKEQSILNMEWAKFYSKLDNAQIILTHIVEESYFLKKILKKEDFDKKNIAKAKEQLSSIATENFDNPDKYKIAIKKGKPYEIIEELAEEFEPEMIILGRNESSSKKKLGSNTLHIISETDYPVVSIYGNSKPEDCSKIILLPIDIHKEIEEQTTVALEYAKLYGAEIMAIAVDQVESVSHDAKMLVKMNKIKDFFVAKGIKIETKIIEDNKKEHSPAYHIDKMADEIKPMLVIIMLRAESNYKSFYIGSVAKEIIKTCNSPVLSVKPWNKDTNTNSIFNLIVNPFDIL